MRSKRLFIWVEGDDDERFVDRIIKNKLASKYQSIVIKKYSQENKKYIRNFFKSIASMGADYLFMADLDHEPCITSKKEKIINEKDYLTSDRIFVVCKEIESWYIAGINQADSKRNKIAFIDNTDEIFKEEFERMIPQKDSKLNFKLELLKCFKDDIAVSKNQSYKYFYSKIIQSRTN
jgi:hypothetical protein